MKAILGALAALFYVGMASPAAAIDCAKTATTVERLVCGRPEIKELDVVLNQLYPDSLKVAQDPETVAATQRDFLAGLEACNGYECIDEAYQARLQRLGTYFNTVQLADAHFIPTAQAEKTCIRIVLPQRPDAKGVCQVRDYAFLGKVGGFDRYYALYAVSFHINGSDFLFTAPVVLTADPAKPEQMELNLALLDLPEIPNTETARAGARPKLKADRNGGRLEFHIANDRTGLRAYGPGDGARTLARLR